MPNVVKREVSETIHSKYRTQHRRREYPKSYFLLVTPEGERKFPYKDPDTGAIHCGLLRGAITRAARYGYKEVESKAQDIYNRNCKKQKDAPPEGSPEEERKGKVEVMRKDEHEVFGPVLVPEQKDSDGDVFSADEIRNLCYDFNTNFGKMGYRHLFLLKDGEAEVLESYCLPTDMEVGDRTFPEGTWMLRARPKDAELVRQIKDGEIVGWSVGGARWK